MLRLTEELLGAVTKTNCSSLIGGAARKAGRYFCSRTNAIGSILLEGEVRKGDLGLGLRGPDRSCDERSGSRELELDC
jgi:hypothetical protein